MLGWSLGRSKTMFIWSNLHTTPFTVHAYTGLVYFFLAQVIFYLINTSGEPSVILVETPNLTAAHHATSEGLIEIYDSYIHEES